MTKSLAELEQELADLKSRANYLEEVIKEAEEIIKVSREEHRLLVGGFRGTGLIYDTELAINKAKRLLEDAKLAHPVLKGHEALEADYVVSRVTPKCLYIRRVGTEQEDRVRTGYSAPDHYWVSSRGLDIKATIARFEEAKKNG